MHIIITVVSSPRMPFKLENYQKIAIPLDELRRGSYCRARLSRSRAWVAVEVDSVYALSLKCVQTASHSPTLIPCEPESCTPSIGDNPPLCKPM